MFIHQRFVMIKAESPLFSVVIATRNSSSTLSSALNSVMSQSFRDFEVVVINDSSSDNTKEILNKYVNYPNLHILTNDECLGLASSLNKGIDFSKGEYIVRFDDDDVCHVDRLKIQAKYLKLNPNIDVLGSGAWATDQELNIISELTMPETHLDIKTFLCRGNPVIHPSACIKRKSLLLVGKYDESLMRMEDLDLWGRMINNYLFHNLPDKLIWHRVRSAKTLTALPPGIMVRFKNIRRNNCKARSYLWVLIYVIVEILRHLGYKQRFMRK
jgi:glycosyltransferase involved in cell wall biosynthesis